jgi:GntR family transcriptional regulator/MocR family aminotransferase
MWGIELNRQSDMPVKRQIYEAFKQLMMNGSLKEGEAMPSTRELAAALSVSRSTVCEAYDMLLAEGFVIAHQGAPTRVAHGLTVEEAPLQKPRRKASREKKYAADFKTGQPDLRELPRYAFEQSLKKAATELSLSSFGYSGAQGSLPLREEIAAYLYRNRGIKADPQDIFITSGATHALHVIAELLREQSSDILIEDPCHTGMLQAFTLRGFKPIAVSVDEAGMRTETLEGMNGCPVYVTPSHQFPLGGILTATRRAALIRFARAHQSYIIEDDYDSEFRYEGEPIAPLHAMDPQRVIYVGTFSKVLYPALRIGYVILPRKLQKRWIQLRTYTDVQNPVFEQAALTDFLQTRRLDRHIQKMRRLYGARRRLLLKCLGDAFGDTWAPWGDAAGLHIAVQFNGLRFDENIEAICREQGVRISSVARYCIEKGQHEDKLLLGYGHLNNAEIENGVRLLCIAMCGYLPQI